MSSFPDPSMPRKEGGGHLIIVIWSLGAFRATGFLWLSVALA